MSDSTSVSAIMGIRALARIRAFAGLIVAVISLGFSEGASALRLCTFEVAGPTGLQQRIGVEVDGGKILDMNRGYALMLSEKRIAKAQSAADAALPADMIAWLEKGEAGRKAVDEMLAHLGARASDISLKGPVGDRLVYARSEVRLLAPVPRPPSFRDAGGFTRHIRKSMGADPARKTLVDLLEVSPLFVTYSPTSVGRTDSDVLWPDYSDVLDYELEIAAVIGKKGTNIPEAEARSYIAGYMVYNDVSARDYQTIEMSAPFGSGKGKNWDGSNVLGPFLVTADEFDPDRENAMIARVNGVEWSRGRTSDMDHKFSKIVSFLSIEQTLHPGDVIGSATVEGGSGMDLRKFINEGDTVELEIEGLGVLRNRFVKSPDAVRRPFPSALATLLPGELNKLPPRPMKLVEVANDVYAGIQVAPNVVAYSNMLYVATGEGLVADTLLDVRRTQQMIDLMKAKGGPWPPKYLVNTHADIDHVWGNSLFTSSEIIGHEGLSSLTANSPKEMIIMLSNMSFPKPVRDFLGVSKEFDLRDVVVTPPTRFLKNKESLDLDLGGVPIRIEHVGPAHKDSDTIVFLPEQRVLFAGDLVFNGLTPHITASYESSMAAYRRLEALDPVVVIPGHGDVTDKTHLVKTRKYFEMAHRIAVRGYKKGLTPLEAAKQADIGDYANWGFPGHILITLEVLYAEFAGKSGPLPGPTLFKSIADAVDLEAYWRSNGTNQPASPAA